jgi:hypothetical protein
VRKEGRTDRHDEANSRFSQFCESAKKRDSGTLLINIILGRVRAAIFCRGKTVTISCSLCVCSLKYPACNSRAPYYVVICGLSGCTLIFHIIS